MGKTTYTIFVLMVVFSASIIWIYYTLPANTIQAPSFDKNIARQAMNEKNVVKVFYIALNDSGLNGKPIGCGDSVIGITKEIPATPTPLLAALTILLGDKEETIISSSSVGNLDNALSQSNLKIKDINMKDATTTVNMTGTISLRGECDAPRLEAQLKETVFQFSKIKEVEFFINGKSLESTLSLK